MEDIRQEFTDFQADLNKRNLLECLAGLFIMIMFIASGLNEEILLRKVAYYEIAFAGVFVSLYILLNKSKKVVTKDIESDQRVIEIYKGILNKEIKLLSNVRYWYVLPLFIGAVCIAGHDVHLAMSSGEGIIMAIIHLVGVFAFSAFIIWLNENKTVTKLKKDLDSLEKIS